MKVVVDFDECASNGVCVAIVPAVFELRSDFLVVLNDHPPAALREPMPRGRSRAARSARSRLRKTDARRTSFAARPLRPVSDRLLSCRERTGGAVQLAVRAPPPGHVHPAYRGHRRSAQPA